MPNDEDFNESMSFHARRHPAAAVHSPAAKPKGGARILYILLRLVVMHIVLTFFFLFAGIAVFILILLCIAGKVLRHRRRGRLFQQQPAIERRGLLREEIRRLPCFRYFESASDDCVVCLEGFREGDWCRVLPGCKHLFHRICVDRWLEKSKACPICRGGVTAGWI